MKCALAALLSLISMGTIMAESQPHYWKPELYVHNSAVQFRTALNTIKDIPWNPDDTVLDIGCGDGRISKLVAHTHVPEGSVLGIDVSADMIAHARTHHGSTPNLNFECIDASDITFNNQFNIVVSFTCLQYAQNKHNVLKRIYSSLKDGGLFVATFPNISKSKLIRVFKGTASSDRWAHHFNRPSGISFITRQELDVFCAKAGFEHFEVIEYQDSYQFPLKEDFYEFLASHPHTNHLSTEDKEAFLWDFINLYLETYPDEQVDDIGITYNVIRFLIRATK